MSKNKREESDKKVVSQVNGDVKAEDHNNNNNNNNNNINIIKKAKNKDKSDAVTSKMLPGHFTIVKQKRVVNAMRSEIRTVRTVIN